MIGIGFGDVALFQALTRLGPSLTLLLTRCLAPPFAAAIEWLWLGTTLRPAQILFGLIVLAGIAVSLAPGEGAAFQAKSVGSGIVFSVLASFGDAFGAVLSRKAYAVVQLHGDSLDGGTAAFQRVIGGLLIAGVFLLVVKWPFIRRHVLGVDEQSVFPSRDKWSKLLPWVIANSLAGQTLGVSCYQWAFQSTPAGIVLPIVATTPLVAMPITHFMDKERVTWPAVVGGVISVAGVIGLMSIPQ